MIDGTLPFAREQDYMVYPVKAPEQDVPERSI